MEKCCDTCVNSFLPPNAVHDFVNINNHLIHLLWTLISHCLANSARGTLGFTIGVGWPISAVNCLCNFHLQSLQLSGIPA